MNIWKIISFIRMFMLLFLCIMLVNNDFYIEGGLLGLYLLIEVVLSRIKEVETRLHALEKENEQ